MDWKMTRKPMMVAMPMTTSSAMLEAGHVLWREAGEELVDGLNAPVLQAVGREDLALDGGLDGLLGFGCGGVVGAEEEGGGLAGVAVELIHGGERDELACALAVLDDAADGEDVVEDLDGAADLELRVASCL